MHPTPYTRLLGNDGMTDGQLGLSYYGHPSQQRRPKQWRRLFGCHPVQNLKQVGCHPQVTMLLYIALFKKGVARYGPHPRTSPLPQQR